MALAASVDEPEVVIALGAVVLVAGSVLGVVPRVGPIRALVFGLRSRFFLRANPTSQRVDEVARVRAAWVIYFIFTVDMMY